MTTTTKKQAGQPAAEPSPAEALPEPVQTISAQAFCEETPRLSREARDILTRIHARERHTREDWKVLAQTYGGMR